MFDMVSRRGFVSLSPAAGLGLVGCSGNKTSEPAGSDAGSAKFPSKKKAVELQVFAANSLEKALPEVQELYTEQTGTTFADTQFKASGDLVEQMRAGAAVDVLINKLDGFMDGVTLSEAKTMPAGTLWVDVTESPSELVDADTREDMFVNDLVIIRAEGSDTKVEAIADVANLDGKIAIGDAKTVPAGKYANQALASVGLYTGTEGDDGEYAPEIADKVALADKVGTAAAYVSTGDCVAGFVYSSDIYRYDGIEEAFVCLEDSHKPIVYPGAVAESSEHADEAKAFIDFCLSNKKAQKIWAKYGFELSA